MSCLPQWPKAHAKGCREVKKHRWYFPWVFSHNASLMFLLPSSLLKMSLVAYPDFPFPIHRTAKYLGQEMPLCMYLIFAQNSCTCEFSESTAILKRQRINLLVFASLLPSAASFPITLKAVAGWAVGLEACLSFWAAAHPNHSLLFRSQRDHWTTPGQ